MAAKSRRSIPPLIRELETRPDRFEFYQAVRLIEKHRGEERTSADASVPLGETPYAERESVRFSSDPSLAFPVHEIGAYRRAGEGDGQPDRMVVRFLGLAGVQGPLPRVVTEWLLERIARKDTAWRDFLDIFNHRLVSLMYRVRKTHRVGLENRPPHRTRFARYLYSLIGLGTDGLRDRMTLPDAALPRYAGLLADRNRTAAGLEGVFRDYFGVDMRVRQFRGDWFGVEPAQQTRLGGGISGNTVLGDSALLGGRFWDQGAGLEMEIGPLTMAQMKRFLPGERANEALRSLVLFFVGPEADFKARFVVESREVPAARLGEDLRLGWTSWLTTSLTEQRDSQVSISIRDHSRLERI